MKIRDFIIESRKCLTPDAEYHFSVDQNELKAEVSFPGQLNLSEKDAAELEELAHNALESILAPYWHQLEDK